MSVIGTVIGEGGGTGGTGTSTSGGSFSNVSITSASCSGGTSNVETLTNPAITSASASGGLYVSPTLNAPNFLAYTSTNPTAPSTGGVLFNRNRANADRPAYITSANRVFEQQKSLYGGRCVNYAGVANGATGMTGSGPLLASFSGPVSAAAVSTGSLYQSLPRVVVQTAGTSGATAGYGKLATDSGIRRGVATGEGGFYFVFRFGVDTMQTGSRWFVGLTTGTSVPGNADITTQSGFTGVGINAGASTVHFISTDASAAQVTNVDLGSNFPALTTGAMYELRLHALPNDTKISYSVERLDSSVALAEGTEVSNMASAGSSYNFLFWTGNGTNAAVQKLGLTQVYVEYPA
jgi:hypothetical protein